MNTYTITVLDTDTYIERRMIFTESTAQDAHKAALWDMNDFETEQITKIVNDIGQIVYTIEDGFLEFSS
tara:strand:+ start:2978 stop:3184 length:207 start_codon:yes stop_codon:yes gene_type:complete